MNKDITTSTKAWDSYWAANDSTNSFEFDYTTTEGPYGVINNFWQEIFGQFNESELIVDLGAGNGALSNLFLQSRQTLNCLRWINIDSAKAKTIVKHRLIEYAQEDIQKLRFSDESVDRFVSMFGLEYADLSFAIKEINRCLKQTGHFHFVLHHADSVISKQSRISIAVFEEVLSSGLLNKPSELSDLTALKRHMLTGLNELLNSSPIEHHDDVKLIGQSIYFILESCSDVTNAEAALKALSEDLTWQVVRLQQQLSAAQKAASVKEHLQNNEIVDYTLEMLKYNDDILAWSIVGHKI